MNSYYRLERFSNECRKTKTKVILLQPITTGTKPRMNQSEIEANTSNKRQAKHVRATQDWFWFSF